ncbi:unnamed protein product [Tetraodon nigroviridis]|uniref:Progonadoliberin n=1 Tax=Tetraodon nigroviridis TaxID=99883 RepID=Q4S2S3_TETNG|nr:unnamed protein product [Tetraodon nigroviridis]
MEANSRVMVQVLLLALALQVALSQHWSYGWLPGGKRSVGELEATIRVEIALAQILQPSAHTQGGHCPLLCMAILAVLSDVQQVQQIQNSPSLLPGPPKRNQRHDVTHLFGWRLRPGDAHSRAGAGPRPNSLNGLYLLHNEATLSAHPNSAHMG